MLALLQQMATAAGPLTVEHLEQAICRQPCGVLLPFLLVTGAGKVLEVQACATQPVKNVAGLSFGNISRYVCHMMSGQHLWQLNIYQQILACMQGLASF